MDESFKPADGVVYREETTNFLNDLEKQGYELPRPDKPEAPKEPEVKKEEPKPAVEEPKAEIPEPKKDLAPKEEKTQKRYVPSYVLEIERKKFEKEKAAIREEYEGKLKTSPSKTDVNPAEVTSIEKTLAEKHGLDEELIKDLRASLASTPKSDLTDEDRQLLQQFKAEKQDLEFKRQYEEEFKDVVMPLVEKEYPGISASKLTEIKDALFEKIQTEEFAKAPLAMIYRGEEGFRGFVIEKRKSAESGRPATVRSESVDLDNISEDQARRDPELFKKYSDNLALKSREARK